MEERLRQELKGLYDESRQTGPPSWRELEKLPYLKACYQEGLRMAMGLLHRQVRISPNVDLECNGWTIPKGTPVSMTNHWIHMDPSVFPDPTSYNPCRWLRSSERMKLQQDYFVPFSKGSRACVAKNLVDMVVYHTLGELYGPHAPRISLYETDETAIRPVHGFLFPFPRLDSPGVDGTRFLFQELMVGVHLGKLISSTSLSLLPLLY
ncbi:uncharacterized protein LDX57_001944 [Aspergillus melleus]|uniref:uncharacterized protein n=1 Tax=Aspergillus melleus TaxID=138277 RepID=UPI001E8D4732|nr:uncharacterized protein LDX57_001944 [Aspergillus melleus]KAH8424189.1 hypothetical protein LDX57_001944 [Aspergillus melleus]